VFPGALGLFSKLDSAIAEAFLTRFPSATEAAWLSPRRFDAWLAKQGYGGRRGGAGFHALMTAAPAGASGPEATALAAVSEITRQRDYLSLEIRKLGLAVVPSQTNFILVDFVTPESAASAFEFLRQHALVVRPMGGYGLPHCLRITIGTAAQIKLTAETLGAWQRATDD
jgi:hypothetical protein